MRYTLSTLTLMFSCVLNATIIESNELIKLQVDSLKYSGNNIFDCTSVYWRIIAHEKDAIPFLIDKISDTTLTSVSSPCKSEFKVGDLAYKAFSEILPTPIEYVTQIRFDTYSDTCQLEVWKYIDKNRDKFKESVGAWYTDNFKKYKWVNFKKEELNDCYRQNNITGHYCLNCDNGGISSDGLCLCKPGFTGPRCETAVPPKQILITGVNVNLGNNNFMHELYFTIEKGGTIVYTSPVHPLCPICNASIFTFDPVALDLSVLSDPKNSYYVCIYSDINNKGDELIFSVCIDKFVILPYTTSKIYSSNEIYSCEVLLRNVW